MFKSWRNDKRKIKAIFRLQFQATKVPQLKKPALIVSLVPEDVGKTTFTLEKSPIHDGTCSWEKPLFITVELIKQPKTGNLKEKIYHFILSSSGSSKSGYLGEASIDFADFAEETEPITVSLPLKFANSGAVLNVTLQRVQAGTNQRYGEDSGDSLSQDESLRNRLSNANSNSFYEDMNLDILSSHDAYQDGNFRTCITSDGGETLNRLRAENKDEKFQLEEIRQELIHEEELNNNLKGQLEKARESNSKLILAVNELDEMLEQKKLEIAHLSVKLELRRDFDEVQDKRCQCNMQEDEDQQAAPGLEESAKGKNDPGELCLLKEKIADLADESNLEREDKRKLENYIEQLIEDIADLQQENYDLSSRLDQNRLREEKMQNESKEYLATIEGLELQVQRLERQLKQRAGGFPESLDSIIRLESQVKALEIELEKQAQSFHKDLDAMMSAKVEQEQRAILAEEALRKTKRKNAATAERLQEEFGRKPMEMTGKLDGNKKLMTKATTEADELRVQNKILERRLQNVNAELSLLRNQMIKTKIEMPNKENDIMAEEKAVDLTPYKRDNLNLTELLIEMSRLEERNKFMESELKDMQERYSDISLRFAEVEGERQQLVMTVRNLKCGKRN